MKNNSIFHFQSRLFALLVTICLLFQAGLPTPVLASAPQAAFTSCAAVSGIPQAECKALVALYNSTKGAGWTHKTGWLQTDTPCFWDGITCTAGHVTKLKLSHNKLTGSLPAQLGNLTNLEFLVLDRNNLTGSIPAQLGNLALLQYLHLSLNFGLTGSIPPELGNLTNLVSLDLSGIRFTGSIPAQLGNLTKLAHLNLSFDNLTGSIPAELGNLANLVYLDLSSNRLTGGLPAQLGSLMSLKTLNLSFNKLDGSVPAQLGSLTNLQTLNLSNNRITGSLPPELGNLTNLQTLNFLADQLTGSIPPELGNLTSLTLLDLDSNRLTGDIPVTLGGLTNINELWLGNNQLTGSIPAELGNLAKLQYLFLNRNQLTGSIPAELGNLTNLSSLDLSNNKLSGKFPSTFIAANLPNLLALGFDCGITSTDPAVVAFITSLVPDWQTRCVKNGDFETYASASKVPANWVQSNFGAPDGKDTIPHTGNYSVKITGVVGKVKVLKQTLKLKGPIIGGNKLTFAFWMKGESIPAAGFCQGQVLLYAGTRLVLTKTISCPTGTDATFQEKTLTFPTVTLYYNKVVIKFTYSKASGTVWFDDVSLNQ